MSDVIVRVPLRHGTSSGYTRGCRCAECTTHNRVRHRNWREKRKKAGIPANVAHGVSTYKHWGCRCGTCRRAAHEANMRALYEGKQRPAIDRDAFGPDRRGQYEYRSTDLDFALFLIDTERRVDMNPTALDWERPAPPRSRFDDSSDFDGQLELIRSQLRRGNRLSRKATP